jgi:hypothetical protein
LNFKSNVFELATRFEFGISSFKRTGVYRLKKSSLSKINKRKALELVGFVGIGAFYFNPKGKNPVSGKWEKLHTTYILKVKDCQVVQNNIKEYLYLFLLAIAVALYY